MPINTIVQQLDEQIQRLQEARRFLVGTSQSAAPTTAITAGRRGPRRMSAEARKRIAEAQRARWARQKGQSSVGTQTTNTSPPNTRKRGSRRLDAAARARIAAAQKARWAKFRGQQKKKAA